MFKSEPRLSEPLLPVRFGRVRIDYIGLGFAPCIFWYTRAQDGARVRTCRSYAYTQFWSSTTVFTSQIDYLSIGTVERAAVHGSVPLETLDLLTSPLLTVLRTVLTVRKVGVPRGLLLTSTIYNAGDVPYALTEESIGCSRIVGFAIGTGVASCVIYIIC